MSAGERGGPRGEGDPEGGESPARRAAGERRHPRVGREVGDPGAEGIGATWSCKCAGQCKELQEREEFGRLQGGGDTQGLQERRKIQKAAREW